MTEPETKTADFTIKIADTDYTVAENIPPLDLVIAFGRQWRKRRLAEFAESARELALGPLVASQTMSQIAAGQSSQDEFAAHVGTPEGVVIMLCQLLCSPTGKHPTFEAVSAMPLDKFEEITASPAMAKLLETATAI